MLSDPRQFDAEGIILFDPRQFDAEGIMLFDPRQFDAEGITAGSRCVIRGTRMTTG